MFKDLWKKIEPIKFQIAITLISFFLLGVGIWLLFGGIEGLFELVVIPEPNRKILLSKLSFSKYFMLTATFLLGVYDLLWWK